MSRVPDRKKQRREYLKRKFAFYAVAISLLLWSLFLIWIVSHVGRGTIFDNGAVLLVLAVCCYLRGASRAARKAKQLPYVPPVIPDALPAAEVLVRGSEKPPGELSGKLLRATGSGKEEASAQELMHIPTGESTQKAR